MRKLIMYFFLVVFPAVCSFSAQAQNNENAKTQKEKKPEDTIEQYFFVMIKTGPKQDFDSTKKAELFKGHMANMSKLYNEGILKVAGPFGANDFKWRGIFIFDCKTKEEAEKIVESDPAVAAGLFEVDIVPWYSAPIGSFTHGKPNPKD